MCVWCTMQIWNQGGVDGVYECLCLCWIRQYAKVSAKYLGKVFWLVLYNKFVIYGNHVLHEICPATVVLHQKLFAYSETTPLCYEGRSKSFATQYDAQMTQAKFLCYYST